MTIGERLREERERLRLSQVSFAELAGTTKQTLFSWETGRTSPGADQLAIMASAGVDVLYVITGARHNNVATTPDELSYLRACRALPDAQAKQAGRDLLKTLMRVYGVKMPGVEGHV
ncbi:MAG: helix-turn-helix domain-containing protein [Azoarcus sp.]|nr:helix-turn-helix domain-containing protein [Azoarcus sp.]